MIQVKKKSLEYISYVVFRCDYGLKLKQCQPWAVIGCPVNNISMATFLGTARPTATAGVEQNRPTLTLNKKKLQSQLQNIAHEISC